MLVKYDDDYDSGNDNDHKELEWFLVIHSHNLVYVPYSRLRLSTRILPDDTRLSHVEIPSVLSLMFVPFSQNE